MNLFLRICPVCALVVLLVGCSPSSKHLSSRPATRLSAAQLERRYSKDNIELIQQAVDPQSLSYVDSGLKKDVEAGKMRWRQDSVTKVQSYADSYVRIKDGCVQKKSKPSEPNSPYFDLRTYDRLFPAGNINVVRTLSRNGFLAATPSMEEDMLFYYRNEVLGTSSAKKSRVYAVLRNDVIFDNVGADYYATTDFKALREDSNKNPVFYYSSEHMRYTVVDKPK